MTKTILKVITLLLLGAIAGWYFGRHLSQESIRAEFSRAYQIYPQSFVKNMETTYSIFKDMDKEEVDILLQDIQKYAKNQVDEIKISTLYTVILAEQIRRNLEAGETNEVMQIISEKRTRFMNAVEDGDYVGTDWEETASKIALRWKEENE